MAVIGINYDGGNEYDDDDNVISNNMVYNSVYLYTSKKEYVFNSGDFVKDWFNAKKKYMELMKEEPFLSQSSSCNHFQGDGGAFDSAYLHAIDGKPVLKYVNRDSELWFIEQRDIYENGWEFFVKENEQPTWEELKKYCES